MKKLFIILISFFSSLNAFNQGKDVVNIVMGSADHTTLVTAFKAAGLVEILKGMGPFTLFAPTNAAFNKLPAGTTVADLLKPDNKGICANILTYHVLYGNYEAAGIIESIKNGNGKATLRTFQGGSITATIDNGKIKLTDESGGFAYVTKTDLKGTNGIVHVIDGVLMPR
jgi:uncharacterized surface protein with fasciclin (FAS1) repeats